MLKTNSVRYAWCQATVRNLLKVTELAHSRIQFRLCQRDLKYLLFISVQVTPVRCSRQQSLGSASSRILRLVLLLCCLADKNVRSNLYSAFSSRMKGLISLSQSYRHLCGKKYPWSLPGALVPVSDKKQRFLCSDNDKDGHLGEANYDSSEYLAFSLLTS